GTPDRRRVPRRAHGVAEGARAPLTGPVPRSGRKERTMDSVQQLERLFAYDEWANREVLANLQAAPAPSPRALKLLNHVVGAELLWLARLEIRPSPVAVWPDFTLAQ